MEMFDVTILGAGPAGLAAGLAAAESGSKVLIVEREDRPGGILKQCIHEGFGLIRFGEKLTGPEYAHRYVAMVREKNIPIWTSTFVLKADKNADGLEIQLVNSGSGVFSIRTKTLVLASGCRERTAKQVSIHGTRPAGVLTAGTAQHFVNIEGFLPCRKCVILGSGDIGLIMARRLTLEGAEVVGVYEAKPSPSGLSRNIAQCLEDYNIPLHLSHTVTRIVGDARVEAVEIAEVDDHMVAIPGTESTVECDGVILSVGLIPENEMAQSLGVSIDDCTKGPVVDQNFMTSVAGVFSCGNALHVNDLVDYVSESGECAGRKAAAYAAAPRERRLVPVSYDRGKLAYVVPQNIDTLSDFHGALLYFRSKEVMSDVRVQVQRGDKLVFNKQYNHLLPPEMERAQIDLGGTQEEWELPLTISVKEGTAA
jgi:thioredoxin reductase